MGVLIFFLSEEITQLKTFRDTLSNSKEIEEVTKYIGILEELEKFENMIGKIEDNSIKNDFRAVVKNIVKIIN